MAETTNRLDRLILNYPAHIIWHLLKKDITFKEQRILHAIIAVFNETAKYVYDNNIVNLVERDRKKKEVTTVRINGCYLHKYFTTSHYWAKGYLETGLLQLEKSGFAQITGDEKQGILKIELLHSRKSYKQVPFNIIDRYGTKNILVIKLVLWLAVRQLKSNKDAEGFHYLDISVGEFVLNNFIYLRKLPYMEVNRKIKEAVAILAQKNPEYSVGVEKGKYLYFKWKPLVERPNILCNQAHQNYTSSIKSSLSSIKSDPSSIKDYLSSIKSIK